jgi:hypothetical protein
MLRSFCFVFCMQGDSIKKEPSTGKLPHDYAIIVAQMKKRAPKNSREVLTVWDFFLKFNLF